MAIHPCTPTDGMSRIIVDDLAKKGDAATMISGRFGGFQICDSFFVADPVDARAPMIKIAHWIQRPLDDPLSGEPPGAVQGRKYKVYSPRRSDRQFADCSEHMTRHAVGLQKSELAFAQHGKPSRGCFAHGTLFATPRRPLHHQDLGLGDHLFLAR